MTASVHPYEPPLARRASTFSKICQKARKKKNACIAMFACFLNALGRQNKTGCCELACTSASKDVFDPYGVPDDILIIHQESTTRKLAFGGLPTGGFTTIQDEKKAKLGEFYNNSTLTFISKFFSGCILFITLFILLRSLSEWNNWPTPMGELVIEQE